MYLSHSHTVKRLVIAISLALTSALTQAKSPYLFDYAVKNPQYESHMPYDTVHGVIAQGNKIIVPAEYGNIALTEQNGQTQILAFDKFAKSEDVIHRFDSDGRPLSDLPSGNHFTGEGAYTPPRFTLQIKDIPKEQIAKEFEMTERFFREQVKGFGDSEDDRIKVYDLAKQARNQFNIDFSNLVDTATGTKTDLKGKGIGDINIEMSPNEIKTEHIPALSNQSKKWGYINANAHWVVAPTYKAINRDSDDLQVLYSLGDSAMLSIYTASDENGHYSDCRGFVGLDGKKLGSQFESIGKFDNGFAIARPCQTYDKPYDYNGLMDKHGNWVIEPKDDFTVLTTPDKDGYLAVENTKTQRQGVMNTQGNWVIPAQYFLPSVNEIRHGSSKLDDTLFDNQGLLAVMPTPDSQTYGFMTTSAQWQIPPTLITNRSPSDGNSNWANNGINSYRFDQHGFTYGLSNEACLDCRAVLDTQGHRVFKDKVGYFGNFNPQGYAPFVKADSNVMQVIDKQGNFMTEPIFTNALSYLDETNTMTLASDKDKAAGRQGFFKRMGGDETKPVGVIDYKGSWLLPATYESVQTYEDFAIVTTKSGKYGVTDYQNQWIIEPQAYPLKPIGEGIVIGGLNAGL